MTARSVWVLRHAKATAHAGDDHGRPLAARGRRQASEVGRYLADGPIPAAAPTTVLSSSALRARQTAELVVAELSGGAELVVERDLYGADPDDVVDRLRLLHDDVAAVLVVGHNPTMHELAALLVSPERGDERARVEARFPTAALACVGVDLDAWPGLALGDGRLLDLHFTGG